MQLDAPTATLLAGITAGVIGILSAVVSHLNLRVQIARTEREADRQRQHQIAIATIPKTLETIETVAAIFYSVQATGHIINRSKEVLEAYSLESLSMVGSLQREESIFALIKSPDGTLHRVKKGNYLGQNFGKIDHISEAEVKLVEIVQGGVNEWTERTSALMLKN